MILAKTIKTQLLIVLGLWLAAIISIAYIDRPLALFIHQRSLDNFIQLCQITERLPVILPILVMVVMLFNYNLAGRWSRVIGSVYFYLCLKLTIEIKTALKVVFGRYWTKTWINNNLSLIHDNVFGFNWWHGQGNQGSFPSGHSTFVAFCCVWLCYIYPRFRWLWITVTIIMPACLIALNYHFLGDCLAGVGLGMLCALLSYQMFLFITRRVNLRNYKNLAQKS